ncbi:hypothetical protein OH710_17430 [Pseudomonas capsici]|uniref:hypothetical protein n=1 Tax=Pseudomonas capsici TaxID=2810614 RepID=UPI0011C42727|nr:hypothetical protein [Pseudomonas capsici]MCV4274423.1 hypothetical protein [Pseudomonas capsici]
MSKNSLLQAFPLISDHDRKSIPAMNDHGLQPFVQQPVDSTSLFQSFGSSNLGSNPNRFAYRKRNAR